MSILIDKLKDISKEIKKLNNTSDGDFKRLCERLVPLVKKAFGDENEYIPKIQKLEKEIESSLWGLKAKDLATLENWIVLMIDDLEILENSTKSPKEMSTTKSPDEKKLPKEIKNIVSNKVFIVHGHNDEVKVSTARVIEKLGLKAVILHEQANAGSTLIEKFTKHSDVGFAVILLTADDYGYPKKESPANIKLRARQNVIFELGFFTALLGRDKVIAIYENVANFELPSDIQGVIYIPYNQSDGKWQFDLSKELLHAGFNINTNNLVSN